MAGISFADWGLLPKTAKGLLGIITAPLIHGDWSHLGANSVSLFVLTAALFYFYREIALQVFFGIWLLSGLWVWLGAREAYHIGASGVVYGTAAFLFVSGLVRRNPQLSALAMFVVFVYGSLIWGIFPQFYPEQNISWESHLAGLVAGLVLAVYYRRRGPRPPKYQWEIEEEYEINELNEGNEKNEERLKYSKSEGNGIKIKYHYSDRSKDH